MQALYHVFVLMFGLFASIPVHAAEFAMHIPMFEKNMATFYTSIHIPGIGDEEVLFDTGSGYTVIRESVLLALERRGKAEYLRNMSGITVNEERVVIPVYRVQELALVGTSGNMCTFNDIEVVAFPGVERSILGLSVIRKLKSISVDFISPAFHFTCTNTTFKEARNE